MVFSSHFLKHDLCLTKPFTPSNVFLGLALEKQNQDDESEQAYNVAAKAKPSDPLVWQGLITLFEKQGGLRLREYHDAALHLAKIYMEAYVDIQPKPKLPLMKSQGR